MELDKLITRTQELRQALPTPSVKQRLAETAQALSRAGDNQARVELLNEAIMALISILYETDAAQYPANIDGKTWRLLVPAPWGRAGWRVWGLRYWEGEILRKAMLIRAEQRRPAPLFDYNEGGRTWHLNLGTYPQIDAAFSYVRSYPITLTEWHRHADIYRSQAHRRMSKYRTNGA